MSWQPGLPPPQTSQSVPLAPFNQQQNQSQQWQQVNQQPVNPPPGHLWQGNSGNPGWQADLQRQQVSGGLTSKAPHQQSTTSNSGAPYQPQSMTSKHFQAMDAFDNPGDGWGDWDWNDNQQQPPGQQNFQQFQHQQFQQVQQPTVQSPNNNRFVQPVPEVNAFPQAPQVPQVPQVPQNMFSQPPVSFTPSPQQNPPQNPPSNFSSLPFVQQVNQNVIDDSFSTDHGSWNWNSDAKAGQKTSPQTSVSSHSRNASTGGELVENQQLPENILASLPDEARNTQGNLPNPLLSRVMKSEHQLTPQWSTESQMSHSSSDRSGESENVDSRSSMTTSEEPHNDSSRSFSPKKVEYNHQVLDRQPDKLDETLMALSVSAPPKVDSPKSPPLERQTQSPGILSTPPQTNLARASPGPPPPVASLQRSSDRNPFKRSGMAVHKTLQFQAAPKPTVSPENFYQPPVPVPQETVNQETLVPDNAEVVPQVINQFPPVRTGPEVENHEIAPNNDRNQFLETGHLAEEHLSVPAPATNSPPSEAVDSLPPPGLSRYVLGEPEVRPSGGMSVPEPPPGLDRMVPGTDLANASNLNMERQADGQVSNLLSTTNRRMVQQVPDNTSSLQERNLYLASSETEIQPQSQRVVTGDESGRHTFTPIVQPHEHEMMINDQRRDLEVDGENLQDQQSQRIDRLRDEPIEGANTGDDDQTGNIVGNNATEAESVATNDTGRKDASNVSTCDDSDKDRNYYKSGSRRDDRRKPKERYDSEDSEYGSDHGRRRYREGSNRDDRYERDRDKYGRYEGRYSSREEYNRRRDDRDDIDSRRDEKGRRYRREYDRDRRDDRRKDDRYRDRDEKDRDRRRGRRYDYDDDYSRRDRDVERERGVRDDRRKDDRYRDREEKDRDRRRSDRRYDYEDPYNRSGSRNTDRDRMREKDPRYNQGYYQQGYGYDYSYYSQQQMQYYEALRRTNPQAYAEWYRKYYAQMQPQIAVTDIPTDGRESVHSGRSSANDKERFDNTYNLEKTSETAEVARLTPRKFTNEHTSASLSAAGLLVCIKPRYTTTGVSNLVKILNLGANDATRKLFHAYPGPLVRGITHKRTVIGFCEDQIRLGPPSDVVLRSRGNSMSSLCSQQSANRASFTLLWNLLILLLRQNGMVVGTDISELLMKNKTEFPCEFDQSQSTGKISSDRNSVQSDSKKSRDNSDADVDESADEDERQASEEKQTLSPEEVTNKFRNYLLYGNVNEALDWATENNLWGHALFLASKVDRRSHANVMMKFANKLPLSDPLQTLYQLMSLRTPSSVTSAVDEKWGDWRPHLAMIISNTSQKPELNIKAITTLGDSLYNRGDIFGAHFCYLMAQVNFGKYRNVNQDSSLMSNTSTSPRLILLGSSPHRTFRQFATNEAIMMTEIYEYACTLNDEKFSVTEFQPYKYILASRMIDYGMQLKALLYMEQISRHIQKDPSKHEAEFIERVFVMADRLKYYDPMHEKSLDDNSPDAQDGAADGQNWLSDLQSVLRQFNSGVLSYHSSSVQNLTQDPQPPTINTGYPPAQTADYLKSEIDEQFREINQQFNQLNLQYQAEQQQQQQQQNQPISLDYSAPAMNPPVPDYQSQQLGDPYQNQYPSMPYGGGGADQGNPMASMDSPNYYDPSQFGSVGQHNVDNTSNYDYYGQSQSNTEMPKPQITMPNSFSNKPGFYQEASQDNEMKGKQNDGAGSKGHVNENNAKKASGKESKGVGPQNNQSSGWFGGIWGKFSLKPKNQMILPDDKNPTIVWDPDKKKWVNTDGEADEGESFKPPPKMSDLALQSNHEYSIPHPDTHPPQIPQPVAQNVPVPVPASTPVADGATVPKGNNLQSNMFKMQRNRTLKNSYVDVFNPSGAPMKPVQPVLAPTLPSVPQAGFFVPPTGSGATVSTEQSDNTPQFYNPNQFGNFQQ